MAGILSIALLYLRPMPGESSCHEKEGEREKEIGRKRPPLLVPLPSLLPDLPSFSAPFLSVDRMLITARMTLVTLPGLSPPLKNVPPSPLSPCLFTAPSRLLIFSATSLIMPPGHPSPFDPPPISSRRARARAAARRFSFRWVASSLLNGECAAIVQRVDSRFGSSRFSSAQRRWNRTLIRPPRGRADLRRINI